MIGALIFDLGGVLIHLHQKKSVEHLQRLIPGLSEEYILKKFKSAHFMADYESGRMGSADFLRESAALFDNALTPLQMKAVWQDLFSPNLPMISFLQEQSQQYPCVLLSNTNDLHMTKLLGDFDFFSSFTGQVLSYEVGMMKPHREIYELAVLQTGMRPQECLFIDDKAENTDAAVRAGLQAIQFTDNSRFFAQWKTCSLHEADQ